MNKKGKGIEITSVGLVVIALLVAGVWYGYSINWGQPMVAGGASGATGGGTGGGTINVINTNPADTVTLSFTGIDKLLKENSINTTYRNLTVNFAVKNKGAADYVISPSITVPSTSSGASKTGIPVGSSVRWFAKPVANNITYIESGQIDDVQASTNIEVAAIRHPDGCAGINAKILDINANAFTGTTCASANNTVNITSIGLTAGGSSKTYDIQLAISDPYSQFGRTGILVGCDSVTASKYTVGVDGMTKINTLPMLAQNLNVKQLFQSNLKTSVTAAMGQSSIGKISLQLNAGQTASDPVTCWIFDKAPYLKTDGVSTSDDINDDTVNYKTVGSSDIAVQFTA